MLINCLEHTNSELLIVEGKSAANALKCVRDRRHQAVLALQGKIPNAAKVKSARKLLENPQIISLLTALNSAWSGEFRVDEMRYQRLIILTDPDADGIHTRVLIALLFFIHLRNVVEQESLFNCYAPLYGIDSSHFKIPKFAHTEKQYLKIVADLEARGISDTVTTRYKGLAGMDQTLLKRCCVDKESRAIKVVTTSDCQSMLKVFGVQARGINA